MSKIKDDLRDALDNIKAVFVLDYCNEDNDVDSVHFRDSQSFKEVEDKFKVIEDYLKSLPD